MVSNFKRRITGIEDKLINEWHSKTKKINYDHKIKATIEKLLIPHKNNEGFIDFEDESIILEKCLHLDKPYTEYIGNSSLEVVNNLAGFTIKEKAPIFVGARMGRPEKAKERKMSPLVHSLFPVSEAGGPQRDIVRVEKGKTVKVEIAQRKCKKCGVTTYLTICKNCGGETEEVRRAHLKPIFGARYEEYCVKVHRFIPGPPLAGQPAGYWNWTLFRQNNAAANLAGTLLVWAVVASWLFLRPQ